MNTGRQWLARDFAKLAGTTVRALHHYDRIGVLHPSRRTSSGYRVYDSNDLARLEQISVLKFLGLSLKQIRVLLDRKVIDLAFVLRAQKRGLLAKQSQIEAALRAIAEAERVLATGGEPNLQTIIEVIGMTNDPDWMMRYYDEEARQKVEGRKKLWSPELQADISKKWSDLSRDIEAALGEDPAGPVAQSLAHRWRELVAGFTGGDPQIQKGLNAMHADRENWPVKHEMPYSAEAERFIRRALAVRPA